MHRGSLLLAALLAAVAVVLLRALVTRDGVGPLEYAVGGVLVALLLMRALWLARRASQRA